MTHIDFDQLIQQHNKQSQKQNIKPYVTINQKLQQSLKFDKENIFNTNINISTQLSTIVKDMSLSTDVYNQSTFVIIYGLIFQGLLSPDEYLQYLFKLQGTSQKQNDLYKIMITNTLYIFSNIVLPYYSQLQTTMKQYILTNLNAEQQTFILPTIDTMGSALNYSLTSCDNVLFDEMRSGIVLKEGKIKRNSPQIRLFKIYEFKQITPEILSSYFQFKYNQLQQIITPQYLQTISFKEINELWEKQQKLYETFIKIFQNQQINPLKYLLIVLKNSYKLQNLQFCCQIIDFIQQNYKNQLLNLQDLYSEQIEYEISNDIAINSPLREIQLQPIKIHAELSYVEIFDYVIQKLGAKADENIYATLKGKQVLQLCSELKWGILPVKEVLIYYLGLVQKIQDNKIELEIFLNESSKLLNFIVNNNVLNKCNVGDRNFEVYQLIDEFFGI